MRLSKNSVQYNVLLCTTLRQMDKEISYNEVFFYCVQVCETIREENFINDNFLPCVQGNFFTLCAREWAKKFHIMSFFFIVFKS